MKIKNFQEKFSFRIESELMKQARILELNLSELCRDAIKKAVKNEKSKKEKN